MPDGAYSDEWNAMTRIVFSRIKLIIGWYHVLFAIHSVSHLQNKPISINIVAVSLDYEQLVCSSISRIIMDTKLSVALRKSSW
jgi:hypothetical protein